MEEIFDVIFVDDDRTTILDIQKVKKGEKAEYKGETPTKEPTAQIKYTFESWVGEEKLECITEKTVVYAKYVAETINATKEENAMFNASLENAENANLKTTLEAGKKVSDQQLAVEKDSRTVEEIINDILENGKTEVGQEKNQEQDKIK